MAGRDADGRTPRGVRGLKSLGYPQIHTRCPSHPSRGAWIEICVGNKSIHNKRSHPSRGAWIEMFGVILRPPPNLHVAPLAGCVD